MAVHDRIRLKQIEREAEGYLELGMAQSALDALARAGENTELSSHGHYLRGESLRVLERYEEAIPSLRLAALQGGEHLTAIQLATAWCYKRTGQLPAAIDAMEHALEREPQEGLIHYNLACYLSLAGEKGRALGHLSRAFELESGYRALVDAESDFDSLRSDPQFQALTGMMA